MRRRRDFIVIAVGAWLQAARAQQKAMPVIGYLSGTFPDPLSQLVAGFRQGLNETAEPQFPGNRDLSINPQQPATQRVELADDPAAPAQSCPRTVLQVSWRSSAVAVFKRRTPWSVFSVR